MCYEYVDKGIAGISSHAKKFVNSSRLGQCSRCLINIPHGHPCGIEAGKLVCFAEVKQKKLTEYKYGSEVLQMLKNYNDERECA